MLSPQSDFCQDTLRLGKAKSALYGALRAVAEAISCAQEQQDEGPDTPSFGLVNETLPQPVWILMGGDSSQRQASLASGLNAWMSLRHQADYQVCPKADLTGLADFC